MLSLACFGEDATQIDVETGRLSRKIIYFLTTPMGSTKTIGNIKKKLMFKLETLNFERHRKNVEIIDYKSVKIY